LTVTPKSNDPTEIAVFIIKGNFKGKDVPMGKMDTGKKVLFNEDYHQYLQYGEVWICKIVKDFPTYCFAYPFQKVSGVGNSAMWRPMPPLVSQLFVEKLTDEIAQKEAELKAKQVKKKEYQSKFEEVERKYREMEAFLETCDDEINSLMTDVKVLREALDFYAPQTVNIGVQEETTVGPDDVEEDGEQNESSDN